MAGSISSRRSTTGWSGPSSWPEAIAEQERVADLAGGAGDGHVEGGAVAMAVTLRRCRVRSNGRTAGTEAVRADRPAANSEHLTSVAPSIWRAKS